MRHSPRAIGFFQAFGIAGYVSVFAAIITYAERLPFLQGFEPPMPLGPILFLLAFIISATVCSSLMFGYPLYLFVHDKKREAAETVLWSVCWLALIFLFIAGGFLLAK